MVRACVRGADECLFADWLLFVCADNMTIAVDDVVPQLNKMGFPQNLCTVEQLKELANREPRLICLACWSP